MRYFKTIKDLSKVGIVATSEGMAKVGIYITANMQMVVNGVMVTYGKIVNEYLFNNSKLNLDDFIIFDSLELVNQDIEDSYEEVLVLDPLALQLDLQLSGKDKIKDYDPEQPIDSQYNLKKIKAENMGGVKASNKKAKIE